MKNPKVLPKFSRALSVSIPLARRDYWLSLDFF